MSIVGLDIGTTGVKAVVFREDGTFVTAPYREYDLESPKHGHLELNPNEVLDAVREVLGKAAEETKDDPIRSLATSTLGEAMVPVDADNKRSATRSSALTPAARNPSPCSAKS